MAVDPPFRIKNMMPGMIMLWYGSIASIPSGWTLCDGTMGTPDLGDILVFGADDTHPPNTDTGSSFHHHDFTGDGHSHGIPAGSGLMAGTDYALETDSDPAVGETSTENHKPYGMRLCYIMKL